MLAKNCVMFPEITKTNIFLIKIVFSQVFDFIPNAVLNIVNILLLLLLLVVVVVVVVVVVLWPELL